MEASISPMEGQVCRTMEKAFRDFPLRIATLPIREDYKSLPIYWNRPSAFLVFNICGFWPIADTGKLPRQLD
jgi:hypothetical protein